MAEGDDNQNSKYKFNCLVWLDIFPHKIQSVLINNIVILNKTFDKLNLNRQVFQILLHKSYYLLGGFICDTPLAYMY